MTPDELTAARATLGDMWRLGEPLSAAELGRLLELEGRDPGARVRAWETGRTQDVPGPVCAYVRALLDGYRPPHAPRGLAPPAPEKAPPSTKNRRRGA